jgi:2-succinyl-5-enolpyruvyl-6-hydroxy-3-cyclohexene-1-carboxylate synthase
MSRAGADNWGIFGDLTTLYDLAGCWVVPQLEARRITLVVVNNGGGMLFKRMYPYREMLNEHALSFRPLAEMWGFEYQCVKSNDKIGMGTSSKRLIELIPDAEATERFWKKYHAIEQSASARNFAKGTAVR